MHRNTHTHTTHTEHSKHSGLVAVSSSNTKSHRPEDTTAATATFSNSKHASATGKESTKESRVANKGGHHRVKMRRGK